jgi:hypothetical protein
MAIRILPFRQYDENEVINMFAFDGTVNAKPSETHSDAGMVVQVKAGNPKIGEPIGLSANSDLLGPSDYPNVARNYYPEAPMKVEAASTGSVEALGITLAQTLTHDENGENLLRYPQKKAELFAVTSGEAVPIATRGIFTLGADAFTVLNHAHKSVKVSTTVAGKLESEATTSAKSVGKILATGTRASQNGNADQFAGDYAVVKFEFGANTAT